MDACIHCGGEETEENPLFSVDNNPKNCFCLQCAGEQGILDDVGNVVDDSE